MPGWIREAYDELDREKSLAAWQRIFGTEFKVASAGVATKEPAVPTPKLSRAPKEDFIEERYPLAINRTAVIKPTGSAQSGFRTGPLSRRPFVAKGVRLTFDVTTDTPPPYELWWKVRNTGDEARWAGDLRGELRRDGGNNRHLESAKYAGEHWVDVYVVTDKHVVATDRQMAGSDDYTTPSSSRSSSPRR